MGKRNRKGRTVGRRSAQPARVAPKSKAINPIVVGAVAFTMIVVLVITVAPQAGSTVSQSPGRPSGATTTIDSRTQQRIANLEEALKADPKNLGILVELGNIYYDTGQFAKAVDRYSQALEINPNDVNVRVDLGTSYLSLNMVSQAIKEYREALKIDPQKPQAHLNLGNALVADTSPNVDEAIEEWQKAIQYAGGDSEIIKKAQDQISKYRR